MGNIVTTITVCLIVIQIVNLVRIFTEFKNHINILILGKWYTMTAEGTSSGCWLLDRYIFQLIYACCFVHCRFYISNWNTRLVFLAEQFGLLHLEDIPIAQCVPTRNGWPQILLVFGVCMVVYDCHGWPGHIRTCIPR